MACSWRGARLCPAGSVPGVAPASREERSRWRCGLLFEGTCGGRQGLTSLVARRDDAAKTLPRPHGAEARAASVPWETLLALIAIPQRGAGRPAALRGSANAARAARWASASVGVCLRAPSSTVGSGRGHVLPPWGRLPGELALIIGLAETEQGYPCPQGARGPPRFPRRQGLQSSCLCLSPRSSRSDLARSRLRSSRSPDLLRESRGPCGLPSASLFPVKT